MKKLVLSLVLVGALTAGGTVIAFADNVATSGFGHNRNTGVKSLMEEGLTFEEAKIEKLENNFERVDDAVERGTITSEEGAKIKTEMESNSAKCVTPGENKGTHEGYGLNKGLNGKGKNSGKCAKSGLKN